MYTLEQRKDIVSWYLESKSPTVVRRKYSLKYSSRCPPRYNTILSMANRFNRTFSLNDRQRPGRPKTARSNENICAVDAIVSESPTKSVRTIASESNLNRESVRLILVKELRLKPYRRHKQHELTAIDYPRRAQFSRAMLDTITNDPDFLSSILFSDESFFYLDPSSISYNSHYWASQDPHYTAEHPLQAPRIIVWCALSATTIIGPYFYEETVTSERYLRMLRVYVMPALRRKGLVDQITFQQDGAAPHTSRATLDWLVERFPGRLISFKTDRIWPPRSPDLSPLDFFLWGFLKDQLKPEDLTTMDTMKRRITQLIRQLNRRRDLLEKVIQSFKLRLERCILNDGGHVES